MPSSLMLIHYDQGSLSLNPKHKRGFKASKDVSYEDALKLGLVITSSFSVIPDPFFYEVCKSYRIDTNLVPSILELGCVLSFVVSSDFAVVELVKPSWFRPEDIANLKKQAVVALSEGFNAAIEHFSFDTIKDIRFEIKILELDYSLEDMFLEAQVKLSELKKFCPVN
ncbi:MAG: hypothetical protein N2654_02505 [Deltaproteobacteria bacterium]|nr:hypothetical protein [Deltaproteobacteria bacterium]